VLLLGVCKREEGGGQGGGEKDTHTHTHTRASKESERGLRCWMARAVVALHQTAAGAILK